MVFDTNVLVYSAREDTAFHSSCRRFLTEAATGPAPVFLTWNVCYEFLRVITHLNIYPHPWSIDEGRRFLETLLESSGFNLLLPTERHLFVLAEVAAELPDISGNRVHDTHTVVLMREHGIRQICTLDSDFQRFPYIEVIDPTQ